MGRSANASHYKWHVSGVLDGIPIDKRYLSIQAFLDEYGGEKTALQLNRHKVKRFRTSQEHPLWQLVLTPIKEKRTCRTVYFS
jgi:hypothetical protein